MPEDFSFLSPDAADLRLHDPEDRAIFRMRVAERLKSTTVECMREWLNSPAWDRYTLMRSCADAYLRMHREDIRRAGTREKIFDEHREGLDS